MGVDAGFALLADTVSTRRELRRRLHRRLHPLDPRVHHPLLDPPAVLVWLNRIQRFLYDVCDPYLRVFRRFVPPIGPLDLSPMIAVLVLVVLQQVAPHDPQSAALKGEVATWHSHRSRSGTSSRAARCSGTTARSSTSCSRTSSRASSRSGASARTSRDKVERLEADLVRYRELETLLRTTLVSAERASQELREQARREASVMLEEAHAEARRIRREALADLERMRMEARTHPFAARRGARRRSSSTTAWSEAEARGGIGLS